MSWGIRIREARGDRSQVWLAEQVGVTQSRVSAWEHGAAITDENKFLVAGALERAVDEIFPWDEYDFEDGADPEESVHDLEALL